MLSQSRAQFKQFIEPRRPPPARVAEGCTQIVSSVSLVPITLMSSKVKSERRDRFSTSSGIDLPIDFNPSNSESVDYDRDLGDPGQFPYTRGIRRNMYRGRLWTMRQYAGYATAEESNARYKYLLSQGTTGLSEIGRASCRERV